MKDVATAEQRGKTRHSCPNCGGGDVSGIGYYFAKCNSCGYSEAKIATVNPKPALDDLIGGLVALGIVAIGAALVGAFLGSLEGPKSKEVLPKYDEENWQRYFR